MKGIVFTIFNKMIEDNFGLEVWDGLIERTKPKSEGVYTTAETYPEAELLNYVVALSETTNIDAYDLIKTFGEFTFPILAEKYPVFVEGKELKEFLLSVHDVIHVEVLKLYPEAQLPTFTYEDVSENKLVMIYESKNDLRAFAEGLINGAASFFKKGINQELQEINVEDGFCVKFTLLIS